MNQCPSAEASGKEFHTNASYLRFFSRSMPLKIAWKINLLILCHYRNGVLVSDPRHHETELTIL